MSSAPENLAMQLANDESGDVRRKVANKFINSFIGSWDDLDKARSLFEAYKYLSLEGAVELMKKEMNDTA